MKKAFSAFLFLVLLICVTTAGAESTLQETYTILDLNKPPELITGRNLTDEEIPQDTGLSIDELRSKISTYGDYIAWVRIALKSRLSFV